jgi:hypothetical protein
VEEITKKMDTIKPVFYVKKAALENLKKRTKSQNASTTPEKKHIKLEIETRYKIKN